MTETTEVAARPATGPSSTSVRVEVIRTGHEAFHAEWPIEWRIPVIGEIVRFLEIGVIRVTGVIWEHESGIVTLWSE